MSFKDQLKHIDSNELEVDFIKHIRKEYLTYSLEELADLRVLLEAKKAKIAAEQNIPSLVFAFVVSIFSIIGIMKFKDIIFFILLLVYLTYLVVSLCVIHERLNRLSSETEKLTAKLLICNEILASKK